MRTNGKCKRMVAFFLAILLMLPIASIRTTALTPPVTNPAPDVFINQVYGRADKADAAISHSFIELYNPTESDIDLSQYSVQYADSGADWMKCDLTGVTIPSYSSLLIRCYSLDGLASRHTINHYDLDWSECVIDNDAFKVALVSHQTLLQISNPTSNNGVLDFVGAGSADYAFGTAIAGISKQKTARRKKFANTANNASDFEILDYRTTGIDDDTLGEVKPRCTSDGKWGFDIVPDEAVDEDKQLVFSHNAGLYRSAFDLTMSTGFSNAVIRYTTDGSDPVVDSPSYTSPIPIKERTNHANVLSNITNITRPGETLGGWYNPPSSNVFKGNVIKARVFSEDGKALTGVHTHSYFINANYGNLAVVSLVTDKNNFFDNATGLYVNGNYFNKGSDWERPVHFELFEPDGSTAVSQNMGVRTHGGVTRNLPQKSLRLYAKSGYDAKHPTVEYDLFEGRAKKANGDVLTSFKRFLLRNSGNDNSGTMFRDALMQSLVHDTNVMIQAHRQSVVFLNGEFWGIYNIRERVDDESIMRKYDIDDVSNIGMLEFVHGSNNVPDEYDETIPEMKDDYDAYMEMWNWFQSTPSLASAANYIKAQTFIDIDNFIDYYIINIFVNNEDWPGNNNQIWRYRTDYPEASSITRNDWQDGRWRWMLKDTDSGFGLYRGDAATDSLTRLSQTTGTDYANATWSTLFFRRLITNNEFKDHFINRFCDLMNTNFKKDVVKLKITEMAENISGTMDAQINRWGEIYGMNRWNDGVETMKTFADGRVSNVLSHLRTFFSLSKSTTTVTLTTDKNKGYLTINGVPITKDTDGVTDPSSWSGTYFINKTQTITATPYEGYRFYKFIVGNDEYTNDTINVTPADTTKVEALFVKDDGTTPPTPSATPSVTPSVTPSSTPSATNTANTGGNASQGTVTSSGTLTAPSSIKVASKDYQRLVISWEKVAGAKTYEIYRATRIHGNYKKVNATTKTGFTDANRITGKTYYYKVRAVNTIDGKTVRSDYSEAVGGKSTLSAVSGFKAKKISSTDGRLNWKKVSGASGYEIRLSSKKKGTYKKVGNTKRLTHRIRKLSKNRTYWYKVRAYRLVSGKKFYGLFSGIQRIKT